MNISELEEEIKTSFIVKFYLGKLLKIRNRLENTKTE